MTGSQRYSGEDEPPPRSSYIGRLRGLPLWQPLTIPNFRLLWVGQVISVFGDKFYLIALPWLTLQLTGSGIAVGTVLMATGITRAVFQLLAGAISDRVSPRTLMLVSDVVRALLMAAVMVLILMESLKLWHLYLLAIVFGCVDAFFFPAYMAAVPLLIPRERLTPANSLLQGSRRIMSFVGPALAGFVIEATNNGVAFATDALTFIISALCLWMMRGIPNTVAPPENDAPPFEEEPVIQNRNPFRELMSSVIEGARYAWKDPVLRALMFFIAVMEFSFTGPLSVGITALSDQRYKGGAMALGTIFSALGGGTIIGTFLAGTMKEPRRRGRLLIGLGILFSIGMIAMGFASNVLVAVFVMAAMGIGSGLANVNIMAWLQTRSKSGMLGRVVGVMMFAVSLLEPASLALAGVMVDLNITAMFVAGGIIILIVTAVSVMSQLMWATD